MNIPESTFFTHDTGHFGITICAFSGLCCMSAFDNCSCFTFPFASKDSITWYVVDVGERPIHPLRYQFDVGTTEREERESRFVKTGEELYWSNLRKLEARIVTLYPSFSLGLCGG